MENILMNELIKEYLSFNNYNYTASVFETESGNMKEPLERQFIAQKLNLVENENTKKLPLLYSLIFGKKVKLTKEQSNNDDKNKEENNS